jgi:hypothetical protein
MFGDCRKTVPGLFSGLVVIAGVKLPIPSRTRPISAPTPMVLRLKTWESRSPPDLKRDTSLQNDDHTGSRTPPRGTTLARGGAAPFARRRPRLRGRTNAKIPGCSGTSAKKSVAGWSSPVRPQKALPSRTNKRKDTGLQRDICKKKCRGVEQPGSSSGS